MRILSPKQELIQLLGNSDFFLWEYYGKGIFDFDLSLDLLEHLSKPREAATEIYRVVKDDGIIAISLPLENLFKDF